jgi:hypothetical protein
MAMRRPARSSHDRVITMAGNEMESLAAIALCGSDLLFALPERMQIVLELPQRTFTVPIWSRWPRPPFAGR